MTSAAVVNTRRTRNTKRSSHSKMVSAFFGFILLICIMVPTLAGCGQPTEGYNERLTTEKHRICYNSVNVREEPNTYAKIVDEYYLGTYVSFTGNFVAYPLHDGPSHLWYELTDGNWITSDAVMDEDEFTFRFGH